MSGQPEIELVAGPASGRIHPERARLGRDGPASRARLGRDERWIGRAHARLQLQPLVDDFGLFAVRTRERERERERERKTGYGVPMEFVCGVRLSRGPHQAEERGRERELSSEALLSASLVCHGVVCVCQGVVCTEGGGGASEARLLRMGSSGPVGTCKCWVGVVDKRVFGRDECENEHAIVFWHLAQGLLANMDTHGPRVL
ncbi:hypothetical protein T484DRAFT_1952043 [Baffinella frigidus]|nr:hypothetical protein T484DRAFT_1952043 [Cryptophyta sp. CCMP2293]